MRKSIIILIFAMGLAFSASAQSPEKIARDFLTALYSGNVTTMTKLLTVEQARIQGRHIWRGDSEKLEMLRKSESEVSNNAYNSSLKIVKFYYPQKDTSKKYGNRFAAVGLCQERGMWKVYEWGY